MRDLLDLLVDYFYQGGLVSIPLLVVFVVIAYTSGYRLSVLYRGRKSDVRRLFERKEIDSLSVQEIFLGELRGLADRPLKSLHATLDWMLLDTYQKIHRFSFVLSTAVLLAPLLGLLGTVIGMIETFASLSNSDLYSSTGGIAGGISQALVTTQFGLVVAIPGIFLARLLKKIENKTYMDILQLKELFLQQRTGQI
ncbi:MAG: MotA/TolQ/ExbB proton channel family protein [Bdellovibrionales bacterium]|nr:MotA/TolQ/ExbB proton channel family protein [Bdellovibrionales bacterium]